MNLLSPAFIPLPYGPDKWPSRGAPTSSTFWLRYAHALDTPQTWRQSCSNVFNRQEVHRVFLQRLIQISFTSHIFTLKTLSNPIWLQTRTDFPFIFRQGNAVKSLNLLFLLLLLPGWHSAPQSWKTGRDSPRAASPLLSPWWTRSPGRDETGEGGVRSEISPALLLPFRAASASARHSCPWPRP